MRELNTQEVHEIGGAFGPFGAAFGGITGAAGYLGSAATSGSFSWGDLAIATGTGVATGAIGGAPVSAAVRYAIPRISAVGGALQGAN
ncbi:MAG: hypothetical protein HLX50_01205 [Alteromonadaceae bacterium]|nr:hypothetical protein [Alteromonadaceae bacterium]